MTARLHIGIDFDNTVVCYDAAFHDAAAARRLISVDVPRRKDAVRDYLRRAGREDDWTALQGYIYGARMDLARLFEGVVAFVERAERLGARVSIVSHKTRYPYRGPRHDLRRAARDFLKAHGLLGEDGNRLRVCFETSKDAKLARIGALGCTHFLDDLPEFLAEPAFPAGVERILFDPGAVHVDETRFVRVASWRELAEKILGGRGPR